MVPPGHKLADRRDFERAFLEGEFFSYGLIALRRYVRHDRNPSRIGFVVGKKRIRSAVDRNRIKRQLRACMNVHISSIAAGYDIVVLYRSYTATVPTADIRTHLEKALLMSKVLPSRAHSSTESQAGLLSS